MLTGCIVVFTCGAFNDDACFCFRVNEHTPKRPNYTHGVRNSDIAYYLIQQFISLLHRCHMGAIWLHRCHMGAIWLHRCHMGAIWLHRIHMGAIWYQVNSSSVVCWCILPITLHAWVALKLQYMSVVGAQPIPVNQNIIYEYCISSVLSRFSILFFARRLCNRCLVLTGAIQDSNRNGFDIKHYITFQKAIADTRNFGSSRHFTLFITTGSCFLLLQ